MVGENVLIVGMLGVLDFYFVDLGDCFWFKERINLGEIFVFVC